MGPSRPLGVAARPTVSTQPQASSPSPPPSVDDKGAAVQRATKRRDAHTRALPCTDTPLCTERVSAARVVDSHTKARERAESRRVNLHPAAPSSHPLPSVCSRIGEEEEEEEIDSNFFFFAAVPEDGIISSLVSFHCSSRETVSFFLFFEKNGEGEKFGEWSTKLLRRDAWIIR